MNLLGCFIKSNKKLEKKENEMSLIISSERQVKIIKSVENVFIYISLTLI